MNNEKQLCEDLPYWEFVDGPNSHAILWDGSVSSGLELLPLDIECFDESRINRLTLGLRALVNSLPEKISAQFFVKVESDLHETLEQHTKLVTTDISYLNQIEKKRTSEIENQIDRESLFRPRLFFFLKTEGPEKPSRFSFQQIKKFSKDAKNNYEDRLQTLTQCLETAFAQFSSLGFKAEFLQKKDFIDLIYKHLNPQRSINVDKPMVSERNSALSGDSPRSQLVFGDLIIDQEDFVLDKTRTRVVSLKTSPEISYAGMMSAFQAMPFKYDLLFTFKVPVQEKEMKLLQQKRNMANSLANSTSNRVSDLESTSKLNQTTELISELIETGQRIYEAELVLFLREQNSPEGIRKLNLHCKEVLSKFKTLSGSEGLQETVASWKIFKNELPLAPMSVVRGKKMKTNNLVDFLPLYGAASGDDVPFCLLSTRLGTLYSMNPYSSRLSNFNALVTGSSGSGKSFANNFLMLQQIARGTKVFIVDVGGSYKKMTEVLGGQYFEINLSEDYAINPFELSDPRLAPSGEKLKSLVNIIEQMVVDQGEKLSKLDRVQIEEALTVVFQNCREVENPRSPILSDFVSHCKNSSEENLRRIAKLMFPWVGDSPFGKLLDRSGKIQADSPIVAFDLKGLSQYPDLQSVMILILTNFILDQVEKDRLVPKRVLLDEAWELLKSPAAAQFMEYAARTFRKTGSGITFITQGVEEIIASGIGPAILNNTATKLVMLQKGDTKILKEVLKLNSQELRLIQSLEQRKGQYSEGFLMEGETRQVIRIQPSPLEYWISTSDARDNNYLAEIQKSGLGLEEAIMKAASTFPYGVANGERMSA